MDHYTTICVKVILNDRPPILDTSASNTAAHIRKKSQRAFGSVSCPHLLYLEPHAARAAHLLYQMTSD